MLKDWQNLFVATAGAAAALTGLIFVGVSINLNRILSFPRLADRALISLVLLVSILLASILLLVPVQPQTAVGVELIVLFVLVWIAVTRIDITVYRSTYPKYKPHYRAHILANQVAVLPYLITGIIALNDVKTATYWVVPGICICFVKAVWDAWVLLVEINR